MLTVGVAQTLAAVNLIALVGGFAVGHAFDRAPRGRMNVVARIHPRRGTERLWVAGALIAALWPVGVLLGPHLAYDCPPVPEFPGSSVVQGVGFAVALGGGLLFFAAVRALGRHMTPEIRIQEGHRLVQEGPYRYIRHPAYTAIVTGAAGLTALFLSLPLAVLTVMLLGLAVYRARLEERLLGSQNGFGPVYLDYVAHSGRFFPRLRTKP